jgi:pimeloyl-ACP methyl ester carboxylesterase
MLLLALALLVADTTETYKISVAPAESIVVSISGAGQPVVFLPGLFGSGYSYRRVMGLLDEIGGVRSIAIEPLGMGSSSRPEEADYSLTAQSERVSAVLDSLGIDRAILVGHSHGASIAMRLAYRHPERVQGIVSIEGGPSESLFGPGMRRAMRFAPMLRMINGQGMVMRKIMHDMQEVSHNSDWVTRGVVVQYTRGLAEEFGATMMAYRTMAETEEPEMLTLNLPGISCPLILLVSEKQHGVGIPADQIQTLTTRLTDFEIDTVPEAGFFIHEENPTKVADAVMRLLEVAESPAP